MLQREWDVEYTTAFFEWWDDDHLMSLRREGLI